MAENKLIETVTSLIVTGDSVTIHTEYKESGELPNTILTFIGVDIGSLDAVGYIEGELMIEMKNYLTQINYKINNQGELILFASTPDIDFYSIDDNGDLIWVP